MSAGEEHVALLPKSTRDVETLNGDTKKQKPQTFMKWMKQQAKAMKKESLAVFYAMQDWRTPWFAKILPFLALSYALCPLDLIPDFIPVLGLLDDILIVPGLLWLSFFLIPAEVMVDARQRAKDDPIRLSRNWVAAVIVFLIWMLALEGTIYWLATEFFWGYGLVQRGLYGFMAVVFVGGVVVFVMWAKEKAHKEKMKVKKVMDAGRGDETEAVKDSSPAKTPRKKVIGMSELV